MAFEKKHWKQKYCSWQCREFIDPVARRQYMKEYMSLYRKGFRKQKVPFSENPGRVIHLQDKKLELSTISRFPE